MSATDDTTKSAASTTPGSGNTQGEKSTAPLPRVGPGGDAPQRRQSGREGGEPRRNSNAGRGGGGGGRGPRRPSNKDEGNANGHVAGGNSNGFQQVQSRNQQRRRTSAKGGEGDVQQGNNRRPSQSGGGRRKDFADRKSFSQGGGNGGGGGGRQQSRDRSSTTGADSNNASRRTRSTNSSAGGKRLPKASTTSVNSNGEGFGDYGNYDELDEPFSDTESECSRPHGPIKMQLPIPRGRIRTLSGTVPVVGFSPKWGGPTMCLSCLHFFDLPDQLEAFSEHLLNEHHIVVSEMELIVDPKRYIEHWRQRFAKESIDNIFPRIEPVEGDAYFGKTEYFFEMSAALPEDFGIRQRLAMRRLEEALSCQQREREDTNFSLQCIFCRYTARGNRSKIIHHLYMIHHLNLGSPDNLVFVTEYIEHLKDKLQRNECIYCEKIFSDRNTLMDHMRKRNHREVNPKNHYYDKFYIINYLELGKRWLDVLAEDFEDTMPTFQDSDEEEEEDSWCEWQEDNVDVDETRVLCLCCEESTESVQALLEHIKMKHELDLLDSFEKAGITTTYDRAKIINYIRKQNYNSTCWVCGKTDLGNWMAVYRHIDENHKPIPALPERPSWDTEEELVGLFGNDHLVWMLESMLDEKEATEELNKEEKELTQEEKIASLVEQSKKNTIDGVVAEELPDLPPLDDLKTLF